MKLKLLITPIAVIVAVVAAAGIILPKVLDVVNLVKEQKKAEQSLAVTEERIGKSSKLNQELAVNTEKQNVLLKYIPVLREEEVAVNNLNAVAAAAGVSIADLSLSKEVEKNANALPEEEAGEISGENSGLKSVAKNVPKTVNFDVVIMGSYDQLKSFLGKLNETQRLTEISSLKISKTKGIDGADSDKLQANMVLGFGYLNKVSIANVNSEVLNSGKFDMSVIDKITNNVKTDFSEINIGQTGKTNPFLP